jgi:hypothetical protein
MTAPDIFSVPRRFDMATVLVAMTGFSLLFTVMYIIQPFTESGPMTMAVISGLFVAVAIGQALVINGGDPRVASIIAGGVYWFLIFILAAAVGRLSDVNAIDVSFLCIGVVLGPIAGYLAGTLVGGVFLVAYHLREHGFLKRRTPEANPADNSPWDDGIDYSVHFEIVSPGPTHS